MDVKEKNSVKKRNDEIGFRSNKIDEKFQKMDVKENKKKRKPRKQENPKRWSKNEKKEKIKANRGSKTKNKFNKEEKKTENNETIRYHNSKNSDAKIQTKISLMEKINELGKTEKNFSKLMSNLNKKLDLFHDLKVLKMIRFLLYLIVKEKRDNKIHM